MSTPRTKRQFAGDASQRQITSYFSKTSTSSPAPATTTTNSLEAPTLPSSVQSSLLNVGMRVRKSVPEGYKTGSYTSLKLFTDAAAHAPATPPRPIAPAAVAARKAAVPTQRELLPFCGINSVGGLAAQESSADEVPGLSLSQDSVDSDGCFLDEDASAAATFGGRDLARMGRKRVYEDDEDEEAELQRSSLAWNTSEAWMDGEVSPRTAAPWGKQQPRAVAVPRRRRTAMVMDGNDFEDADFLDYRGMDTSD